MVGLLALAHESACVAELALAIEGDLAAGRLPDLKILTERFQRSSVAAPDVVVHPPSLTAYDAIAMVRGQAA